MLTRRGEDPAGTRRQPQIAYHPLLDSHRVVRPAFRQDRLVGERGSPRGRSSRRVSRLALMTTTMVSSPSCRAYGDHAVGRPEELERTPAQRRPLSAQCDQPLEFVQELACPRLRSCATGMRRGWPGRGRPSCRSRRRSRSTVRRDRSSGTASPAAAPTCRPAPA